MARRGASPTFEEESDLAWRSAVAACVVLALALVGFGALGYRLYGVTPTLVLQAGHLVLTGIVLAVLLARTPHRSIRGAVIAFLVLYAPFPALLWIGHAAMLERGVPWAPFTGHKLVMIAVAVMMPGPAIWPAAIVVLTTALALVQFFAGGIATDPSAWGGEPWITFLYGGIAVFLVAFRAQHRVIAQRYAKVRAQTDALTEMSRFFLALRDLQNTPIQTLEIDTAILERRHPESATAIKRMRRSIAELRDISRRLAKYDRLVQWEPGSDRFDPDAALDWLERMHDDIQEAEAPRSRRPHREHA